MQQMINENINVMINDAQEKRKHLSIFQYLERCNTIFVEIFAMLRIVRISIFFGVYFKAQFKDYDVKCLALICNWGVN